MLVLAGSCPVFAASDIQAFFEETEEDLPLKREVPLAIDHNLGNITIQGWVQDRIRVTLKKRVLAHSENEAHESFRKLGLISLETSHSFELRVGHSRGVDLVTKLRDEKQNPVSVDLDIRAPFDQALTVLLGDTRSLTLQQWKGKISVVGKNGKLSLTRLNTKKPVQVSCPGCNVELSDSELSGHILVGAHNAVIRKVHAVQDLLLDSTSGEFQLSSTSGKINVHTTSGRLNGAGHEGELDFQSDEGGVFFTGLNGSMEASTKTGQIMVDAEEVTRFLHLDSEKSDIQVTLPNKFEGLLDLMSLTGETVVQFPYEQNRAQKSEAYGPATLGKVDGMIGSQAGVLVHAYSKQGGVRVLRKGLAK